MKYLKIVLAVIFAGVMLPMCAKDLKVLAIGNSFSYSVGRYFPAVVNRSGDNHLLYVNMFIGGCSIEQHWKNFQQSGENPDFKPYQINVWNSSAPFKADQFNASIQDMLGREQWDVIVIQQASHFSFKPETYEPYAGNLIAAVKAAVPGAEIITQQTWSYRKSDPRFSNNGGDWGVDQLSMYEKLTEAYCLLKDRYGMRVIPTGLAVQIWRREAPESHVVLSPAELAAFKCPDLPPRSGDLVGRSWWEKKNGRMQMLTDHIHLNDYGEYLQACVWYLKLFGGSASGIKYVPDDMDSDFAALCQRCAAEAVETMK